METRLKSLIRQKEQVMVELSKVDMPSSNITAYDKIKSDQTKSPKLVLNLSALMSNCNPKVLIGFTRALTTYFDQLPGSYSLIRIFVAYINTEFLSNNMSIAFPMNSNGYCLGREHSRHCYGNTD